MKCLTAASVLLMSVLFTGAALDKMIHWQEFLQALHSYGFVPPGSRHFVAGGLLAAEMFASITLLLRRVRRYALLLGAFLFGVFALLITYLLLIASNAPCGCTFSLGSGRADTNHLLLNVVLAALSVLLFFYERTGAGEPPCRNEKESDPAGHHCSSPFTQWRTLWTK